MKTGLCSVTFRHLEPLDIVKLCRDHHIEGIEWGSDIHAPVGNITNAKELNDMCSDNNLKIPSYGSYYKLTDNLDTFKPYVETANHLGANNIRIWAGDKSSNQMASDQRARIIERANQVAEYASKYDIRISIEYHGNTLTDTLASIEDFYSEATHSNLFAYWQPTTSHTLDEQKKGLAIVASRLSHIHLYNWSLDTNHQTQRHPLIEAESILQSFISYIKTHQPKDDYDTYVFLEFVKDASIQQFIDDAKCLNQLLVQ